MMKRILALSAIGIGLMLSSGPQATAQQAPLSQPVRQIRPPPPRWLVRWYCVRGPHPSAAGCLSHGCHCTQFPRITSFQYVFFADVLFLRESSWRREIIGKLEFEDDCNTDRDR